MDRWRVQIGRTTSQSLAVVDPLSIRYYIMYFFTCIYIAYFAEHIKLLRLLRVASAGE